MTGQKQGSDRSLLIVSVVLAVVFCAIFFGPGLLPHREVARQEPPQADVPKPDVFTPENYVPLASRPKGQRHETPPVGTQAPGSGGFYFGATEKAKLEAELRKAFRGQYFRGIVVDDPSLVSLEAHFSEVPSGDYGRRIAVSIANTFFGLNRTADFVGVHVYDDGLDRQVGNWTGGRK